MRKIQCYLLILLSVAIYSCESDEDRRDRFFQLGNLAMEDRDFDKAIELYNQSLKVDAGFHFALNNRGVAKMEMDHPYEAILDYNQAILNDATYLDALFNRAYAYESIGNFDKSLKDVERIMSIKPDSAFVHFYKGLVLTKNRSYESAMESFKVADSMNPYNIETIINIATIHYFRGELEQAKKIISQAQELDATDANVSNLLSLIHLEQKDYLPALVEINRALDEVPDEPFFINNRGFIYLQMDSLELALEDINKSILINPKNGWAYRNKGIYFLEKEDYDQAIRLFNRALEEPDFIDEIYFYLGNAYLAQGSISEACESWAKGVSNEEKSSKEALNQNCD